MNYKAVYWAMDKDVGPQEKLLLLTMAVNLSRYQDRLALPQEKLAEKCGVATGWVSRHSKALQARGLIHITKHLLDGVRVLNEYHLILDDTRTLSLAKKGAPDVERDEIMGHMVVRSEKYLNKESTLPMTYTSPDDEEVAQ